MTDRQIDRYLMLYAQSTVNGHLREEQNVLLPQDNSDSLLMTHSTVEDPRILGRKMKIGREVIVAGEV